MFCVYTSQMQSDCHSSYTGVRMRYIKHTEKYFHRKVGSSTVLFPTVTTTVGTLRSRPPHNGSREQPGEACSQCQKGSWLGTLPRPGGWALSVGHSEAALILGEILLPPLENPSGPSQWLSDCFVPVTILTLWKELAWGHRAAYKPG